MEGGAMLENQSRSIQ